MDVKYPNIHLQLSGEDGNVFFIIARMRKALKDHKVPKAEIEAFTTEVTSGNYDHALQTCMRWVTCH